MESLTKVPLTQRYAEDRPEMKEAQQTGGTGHGCFAAGDRHEKKSVLKKVKEKVKKLKNTIGGKKKQDHPGVVPEHVSDLPQHRVQEEEEEDEEEEELEEEDETKAIHGGQPAYGTHRVRGPETGLQESSDLRMELEASGPFDEDPNARRKVIGSVTRGIYEAAVSEPEDPVCKRPLHGHERDLGGPDEDPLTKLIDPDSSEEETGSGLIPVLRSVENLKLEGKAEKEPSHGAPPSAGSHGQFAPESGDTDTNRLKEERDQTYAGTAQSVVASAIASGTTAIVVKAVYAKDTLAAKLGYGAEESGKTSDQGGGLADKLTEKLSPVLEKVAGVKETVFSSKTKQDDQKRGDEGVSAIHYLAEKLRPGEEDKALSEVISGAVLHMQKSTEEEEETEKTLESGESNTGVVQKVKEVVGSLVGKTEGSREIEGSRDVAERQKGHEIVEVNQEGKLEEERKLQESTI